MATYYRWNKSYPKYWMYQLNKHTARPDYVVNHGKYDSYQIADGYNFSGLSLDEETGNLTANSPIESGNVVPGEDIVTLSPYTKYIVFNTNDRSSTRNNYALAIQVSSGSIEIRANNQKEIIVDNLSSSQNAYYNERAARWPAAGDLIEYVYSTNPSAYPNGGVSGDYYYDQRTMVESPTAPSGLNTPNPITTPSITVSWSAATSNVPDYTVNLYELSYSTNGGSSWTTVGTTASTSLEVDISPGVTSILFRVRARDSNGQWGGYVTSGTAIPVLLAPTLTVPSLAMQGQSIAVNWTSIEGADSYTLQRKSSADSDWVQVYSGTALTYSETAGTWTSVQYRVQAVFDGTPGGWATSAEIPVVSASALVISGQDGDLGTLVNDVPYSISTDTGNQITATITVNGAVIFSGNVGNSVADVIPVLDLINGSGTIVIEASVTASSGPVSAVRTWTYTKTMMTFPNAGSIAELTKDGKVMWPETLAEAVRIPGGKTLDQVMGFPCQIFTGSYVGTGTYGESNPTEITFPFVPDLWWVCGVFGATENMPYYSSSAAAVFGPCPWGMTPIDSESNYAGGLPATYLGRVVSFYATEGAEEQRNKAGVEYYFIGIKIG